MKNNKKGFTLIELLAVIVILAIIMVIAVPQILNVINDSRRSAWTNSLNMIAHSIEINTTLFDPNTGTQKYALPNLCTNANSKLGDIADLGDIWTDDDSTQNNKNISCSATNNTTNGISTYTFTLNGKNQFNGRAGNIVCTSSDANSTTINCTATATTNN